MNHINYLKASILLVFLLFGSVTITFGNDGDSVPMNKNTLKTSPVECDEIEVKLEITHTSNSQENGEIVMNFKNLTISYTCFLFSGRTSKDNKLEFKETTVSDLAKGDYDLYIQNKNGCSKHIKFKIN